MKVGLVLPRPLQEKHLRLAKQMGVTEVFTGLTQQMREGLVWPFEAILRVKMQIEEAGLNWSVVETLSVPDRVKLGQPGRDEDIAAIQQTIRNLGAAGVPTAVYTWTAVFNWLRTDVATPVRGGAVATSYNHELMKNRPPTAAGIITEAQLWEGLAYFLRAVIPVCEEAGVKLAMHPDDPPLSPIRGVSRIMISPENYQRLIDLVPSPCNGMTFCQGCFTEMGVDVPATIAQFVSQDRVFFAHFRNLRGTAANFTEMFHDDGDADMYAHMKAFYDSGYDHPMRPDHVPTVEGESNDHPGYTVLGRLFAVGYMRGLMEGIEKTRRA